MAFHRCNRFMAGLLLLGLPAALAADTDRLKQSYSEPELHTLAPLGGRVGSSLAVEVRGKFLDGAYAAWLSHDAFEARVKSVEAVAPPKAAAGDAKDQPKEDGEYRVTLQIDHCPRCRARSAPAATGGSKGASPTGFTCKSTRIPSLRSRPNLTNNLPRHSRSPFP